MGCEYKPFPEFVEQDPSGTEELQLPYNDVSVRRVCYMKMSSHIQTNNLLTDFAPI